MARIAFAEDFFNDVDRVVEHLVELDVEDPVGRIGEIVEAIQILINSPEIGRTAHGGNRELVIGRGSRGYVALYRYVEVIETVVILAIRSQREGGYR